MRITIYIWVNETWTFENEMKYFFAKNFDFVPISWVWNNGSSKPRLYHIPKKHSLGPTFQYKKKEIFSQKTWPWKNVITLLYDLSHDY